MRKLGALALAAGLAIGTIPASAADHEVGMYNYYFEDADTGARTITVNQGDTITFVVEMTAYQEHSAVVDGQFDTGPMRLFQSKQVGPLNKPGTFTLYCRAHRRRGQQTTLTVRAAPASSPPAPSPSSAGTKPGSGVRTGSPTPTPAAKASTTPTVSAPAAQSTSSAPPDASSAIASGESASRRSASRNKHPLAGPFGGRFGGDQGWAGSLVLAGLAAIPIFGLAGLALRMEARRRAEG